MLDSSAAHLPSPHAAQLASSVAVPGCRRSAWHVLMSVWTQVPLTVLHLGLTSDMAAQVASLLPAGTQVPLTVLHLGLVESMAKQASSRELHEPALQKSPVKELQAESPHTQGASFHPSVQAGAVTAAHRQALEEE